MEKNDELFRAAADSIAEEVEGTCLRCGRGAANVAAPTLDDLEAIMLIRDGFNKFRRDFSPAVAEQFRRLDRTISYLHRMIAGTRDV
jgi:hypothetical protein